jgi:hypothetical protein
MKENLEAVPIPGVDWDQYNQYAKVYNLTWPDRRRWLCPNCSVTTGVQKSRCKGCGKERVLLREGDGPRGGEIFGWYMRINDEQPE